MLMPKRTKYRKMMRGRMKGKAQRGATVVFGEYALQALAPAWVSSRQIEAARRAITNYLKRGGKVWIRIFPDKPVTQKPAETRMGSGKGNPEYWVAVVKPGRIMFEIGGVTRSQAEEAIKRAAMKMPMDCKFVERLVVGAAGRAAMEQMHAEFENYVAPIEVDETAEVEVVEVAEGSEATEAPADGNESEKGDAE